MTTPEPVSAQALATLGELRSFHNVIVTGPPATGKSRLLSEVARYFEAPPELMYDPKGPVAFPPGGGAIDVLPSPERENRKVFRVTFHQGTRYRDFVSGVVPVADPDRVGFRVHVGPLLAAIRHAALDDGAALVVVDELNRGPAVAAFGDTLTAIEADKRLDADGARTTQTWPIHIVNEAGEAEEVAVPHHLYLLCAMNQADTSVEPLDVAFLRRFFHHWLPPDEATARSFLSVEPVEDLPDTPRDRRDILDALIRAWIALNGAIRLARGKEFQIGHGALMSEAPGDDLSAATQFAISVWARLYAHLEEVFFGDSRGLAAALRADTQGSPYHLEAAEFADLPVIRVSGPTMLEPALVYGTLRSIAVNSH